MSLYRLSHFVNYVTWCIMWSCVLGYVSWLW